MDEGRDKFQQFDVNPVKQVADEPVSTFSADVDTASYSFVRRQLNSGRLPQKDSVRVEEMINYFDYAWPAASSAKTPFKPTVVVSDSPWGKGRKLVHIGIKGYEIPRDDAPGANLVLLLDVSGSMDSPDKLPLAVQSMELLLSSLKPTDTVGIVVYAGAAGTVLEPTPVKDKQKIIAALRDLRPGGSTAGAEGIERAYQLAEAHFRKGGVNRILLATDGDFNVGIAGTNELKGFVERKREKGIFLSVLGFGQGNYRDELAQALAQNGNGVAAYIDTLNEAQKVLVAGSGLLAVHHRQGREAAGGVQSGDGRGVPPGGLRDPRAQARGFQQRCGRRGRCRLRPHGDRHLRDHARGCGYAHGRPEPLCEEREAAGRARHRQRIRLPQDPLQTTRQRHVAAHRAADPDRLRAMFRRTCSATCSSPPRWRASGSCCAAARSPAR